MRSGRCRATGSINIYKVLDSMKYSFIVICAVTLVAACGQVASTGGGRVATISAFAETTPTVMDGANDPAVWVNSADPEQSRIVASGLEGGIELAIPDAAEPDVRLSATLAVGSWGFDGLPRNE